MMVKLWKAKSLKDLRPAILVWNDAYEDAAFDGILEDVSIDNHLQQSTLVYVISIDKNAVKCCREVCYQTLHVRSLFCAPRSYVKSITYLTPEAPVEATNAPRIES
jgi:hypothetical protein